ncbi:MAG: molybdopterin molybdenumtransferase MoeA [Candidatus Bathyarchaeum sp.]|nr:MAG: molybdopterin molybdenumtransferase MoeA [Candidatus Bathyarchaeum sp.]
MEKLLWSISSTVSRESSMFRKLLSFDEAKQILRQNLSPKPIGVERVSLSEAHDRVLAQDVVAHIDIPPFIRSIVDGYAVKAADTFGASEEKPVCIRFCGQVAVGESPNVVVEKGLAAEIATGAPLPEGADGVVMVEYTTRQGDNVFIRRPVSSGENIMEAGSDIRKGEKVLRKSQILSSREIGVLAAIGLTEVTVYKRPKVAILSTGAEVVEPGKSLLPGKIYDINAHALSAAVLESGGEPINLGIIPDKRDRLTRALEKALDSADAVITSGGVSVGPKDLTPQIVNTLGKPGVIISGIAVKPGKPTTIAVVDGKPVFSLPGHPTSSLFMFMVFVRPILLGFAGRNEETMPKLKAVSSTKMFPARGRRTFVMVNLTIDKIGTLLATPVPTGLSGAITTLAKADGFVEISEKQQFVDAGIEVDVYLFGKLRKTEAK